MHLWQANLLEWFTNVIHLWFTSLSHLQAKSPQADPSPSPFEELSEIPNTVRRPNHQVVQDSHQLYCYDLLLWSCYDRILNKIRVWDYIDLELILKSTHSGLRMMLMSVPVAQWGPRSVRLGFFRWDLSAVDSSWRGGSLRWQSPNPFLFQGSI